jgi:hypothetical protein
MKSRFFFFFFSFLHANPICAERELLFHCHYYYYNYTPSNVFKCCPHVVVPTFWHKRHSVFSPSPRVYLLPPPLLSATPISYLREIWRTIYELSLHRCDLCNDKNTDIVNRGDRLLLYMCVVVCRSGGEAQGTSTHMYLYIFRNNPPTMYSYLLISFREFMMPTSVFASTAEVTSSHSIMEGFC